MIERWSADAVVATVTIGSFVKEKIKAIDGAKKQSKTD
jgi:hypothetical protein